MDYIVAALGNPGKQFENTRHNAGWLAMDYISKHLNIKINKIKFKALYTHTIIQDKKVLLLKPQTFMNLSGQSVYSAAQYYHVPVEKIIVICDDIALPSGKIRIRRSGSDGGHNGLKNIIYLLNSDKFPRIKIGVSDRSDPNINLADWVLGSFTEKEQKQLENNFRKIYHSLELIISDNIDKAMAEYN